MDYPKKKIMLYNVAVLEPPRASVASSSVPPASEMESIKDLYQTPYVGGTHSPPHSVALTMATTTSRHRHQYRVLSTITLVGIVYFASCGGPVGSEPLIAAGGPLLGLLGILGYTVLCLTPLLYMVTELSTSFPENGGHAVWAMTAFGPYWGFQSGYWCWVSLVLNNAIYPGLIYSTIAGAYGVEATSAVAEFFIKVAIAIVLAIPSYVGVRFVGIISLGFLVFVMGAVFLLSIWSAADGSGHWYRLVEIRGSDDVGAESDTPGIDWTLLFHTLFWSYDGMFLVSVIGGEVLNPARTFPHVMMLTVGLSVTTYALSWMFVLAADKSSWLEMSEDSLPDVADAIGGTFLHQIMLITSTIGSIGLFTCTLFFQSFLVQGMAQSSLLPALLRKRSTRFKTPQYGLLVSLLTTLALVGFDFESILNMTNAFSGAVQILMVASMLRLRQTFPYLNRPVRMPGNMFVICLTLLPVTAVFSFVIVSTFMELKLALIVVAFAVPGLAFPFVREYVAGLRLSCGQ